MPNLSLTQHRPRDVAHEKLVDEVVRLRIAGHSYREIGERVDRSHSYCREVVIETMREVAEHNLANGSALLGQELERLEGVARHATAIMNTVDSTQTERIRAGELLLRCADARLRWLGIAAPERATLNILSREQLIDAEASELTDQQLDAELERLGWRKQSLEPAPRTDLTR